jgi:predicted RNA binding protein YcfA (HicA-like mRNA interferase family)
MPKPRVLSGLEVVRIFEQFGFSIFNQKGSHIKMRRVLENGSRQTLIVPGHKELDKGTVVSLFRQGTRYISESELRHHFYND